MLLEFLADALDSDESVDVEPCALAAALSLKLHAKEVSAHTPLRRPLLKLRTRLTRPTRSGRSSGARSAYATRLRSPRYTVHHAAPGRRRLLGGGRNAEHGRASSSTFAKASGCFDRLQVNPQHRRDRHGQQVARHAPDEPQIISLEQHDHRMQAPEWPKIRARRRSHERVHQHEREEGHAAEMGSVGSINTTARHAPR